MAIQGIMDKLFGIKNLAEVGGEMEKDVIESSDAILKKYLLIWMGD